MVEDTPNIAVIVLDTLRKDSFDDHFEWLPGTRFENAWSTSHGTVPAHGSLFTGYYSSEVGMTTDNRTLNCPVPVLPELLSEAGYTTRGFSCNTNITPFFNYDRGFDELEGPQQVPGFNNDILDWKRFIENSQDDGVIRYLKAVVECLRGDVETMPSLRAGAKIKLQDLGLQIGAEDSGGREALEWMTDATFEDHGEFLFMNLMEAHGPYAPPEKFRTTEPVETEGVITCLEGWDENTEVVKKAYNDEVSYLSYIYESIYNELESDFDVILTVADHGESFGEYDTYQHLIGVYPELTHIPFCLEISTGVDVVSTEEPVSLIDAFQTVVSVAGATSPPDTRGRDLTAEVGDDVELRRLTEYHGLSDRTYQNLLRRGTERTFADRLDEPCSGVATSGGYQFGSPLHDDLQMIGRPSLDGQEAIEELRSGLFEKVSSREVDVSEDIQNHLEALGYA